MALLSPPRAGTAASRAGTSSPKPPPPPPASAKVLGLGYGGVDELRGLLRDDAICWGLLRFEIGSGSFARTKMITIHCNGDEVPAIKRGRMNGQTKEVLASFGQAHVSVEVKHKEDCTLDFLCEKVLPFMTSDSGDISVFSLKEQYEQKMAEEAAAKAAEAAAQAAKAPEGATEPPPKKKPEGHTVRDREEWDGVPTLTEALQAVGVARGRWNWAIIEPTKNGLHNAGFGGLEEMKTWLHDDKVLFGVIRFGFPQREAQEAGQDGEVPMLLKYAFIHWIGPNAPAIKRGQWNSKRGEAEPVVRQHCIITCTITAHSLEDLEVEKIIAEIQRVAVLDKNSSRSGMISAEEYAKALDEERKRFLKAEADREAKLAEQEARKAADANAQAEEEAAKAPPLPDVATAVTAVRGSEDVVNWVLVGLSEAAKVATTTTRQSARPGAASPTRAQGKGLPKIDDATAEKEELEARMALFAVVDLDGNGRISREEWDQAFDALDADSDGSISRKEWYLKQGTSRLFDSIKRKNVAAITRKEWSEAFDVFDSDQDASISVEEWRQAGTAA